METLERLQKEGQTVILSIVDSSLKLLVMFFESKGPEQRAEEMAEWYAFVKSLKDAPDPAARIKAFFEGLK